VNDQAPDRTGMSALEADFDRHVSLLDRTPRGLRGPRGRIMRFIAIKSNIFGDYP
jgi:hypothetical protein